MQSFNRKYSDTQGEQSNPCKHGGVVVLWLRLWLLTCGFAGLSPGRTHTSLEQADL